MLCNCHSLYAIAQWGREHLELAQSLGFTREQTPCVATLHLVFSRLDKEAFEGALRECVQHTLGDRKKAIAIEGYRYRWEEPEGYPWGTVAWGTSGSRLCSRDRPGAGAKGG